MSTKVKFRHQPLQSDEIRLLKVDLDDQGRELSLTVEHFRRDEAPKYQAISYTWGEQPHLFKTITLNGKPFEVAQNAFWCSHFICKHYRRWQYLWIDSICINQLDVEERNAQVRRMDEVYRDAALVLVWLGSDREISGDVWTSRTRKGGYEWDGWYDSPYWSRMWIVQELYLARQVLFLYGPAESNLNDIWNDVYVQKNLDVYVFGKSNPSVDGVYSTYSVISRGSVSSGPPDSWTLSDVSLLTCFGRFRFHGCYDARDKIFAILCLLPTSERRALERYFPDYDMSMQKFNLVVLAHLALWYGKSNTKNFRQILEKYFDITFHGFIKTEVKCPSHLDPVISALCPLLSRELCSKHSHRPRQSWRKRSQRNQQERRAYEKALVDELVTQEELMHRIIADFKH